MVGKFLRGAAALLVSAFALAPVQAANVGLSDWAYNGGNLVDTTLFDGVAGGLLGRYSGTGTPGVTSFIAYSVQIGEPVVLSRSLLGGYSLVDGDSYFGAQKSGQLARLATWLDQDPTRVDDATESTALQLAIWNIIYDTDAVLTGTFADQAGTYAPAADLMLAGAATIAQPNFRVFVFTRTSTADLLLVQRVPEPASLALAVVALAGLGASRRYAGRRST